MHAVSQDTNHANGFVIDAVEKFCAPVEQREMHDAFIISEGRDGDHMARMFSADDLDDARQAHQETYADERIVGVQHRNHPGSSHSAAATSRPSGRLEDRLIG